MEHKSWLIKCYIVALWCVRHNIINSFSGKSPEFPWLATPLGVRVHMNVQEASSRRHLEEAILAKFEVENVICQRGNFSSIQP